jgi:signal peptidase II
MRARRKGMARKDRVRVFAQPTGQRALWSYCLLIFAAVLLADQLTKYWMSSSYVVGESHRVFSWLSFTYVQNTGALWSFAQGANAIFIWLSFVAFGLLLYFHDQFRSTIAKVCLALLMAGLWGNLLDRLARGFVVDFIDLGWWPVFNIADSALCVAIAVLLLEQWRTRNARA